MRAEGRAGRGSRPFTTRTEHPTRQRTALPRVAFPTLGLPKVIHLQQATYILGQCSFGLCSPTFGLLQVMHLQTQPPQAARESPVVRLAVQCSRASGASNLLHIGNHSRAAKDPGKFCCCTKGGQMHCT